LTQHDGFGVGKELGEIALDIADHTIIDPAYL
jgi:hypothetical protein